MLASLLFLFSLSAFASDPPPVGACPYSYSHFEFASPEEKVEKRLGYLPEIKWKDKVRGFNEEFEAVDRSGAQLGHFQYRIVGVLAKVKSVRVAQSERNKGISELLFARFLEKHPEVKNISTDLIEDNSGQFYNSRKAGMSCEEAIRSTPAYKMRARFGFTVLVDMGCGNDGEEVGFTVSRP